MATAAQKLSSKQVGRSDHLTPAEPPIRSMLFGLERFEQHGKSLAKTHEVTRKRGEGPLFRDRLESNLRCLDASLGVLANLSADGSHLNPAIEWLLDNANVLEEQMSMVRGRRVLQGLESLPVLSEAPLAGLPRIYGVAWAWIAHADSQIDIDLLTAYLRAYQEVRVLDLAELWQLPLTLRVLLLENLRRLAERLAQVQLARHAANEWIDRNEPMSALDAFIEQSRRQGAHAAFVFQLDQRSHELSGDRSVAVQAWLLQHQEAASDFERGVHNEIAASQQSIRNAIVSLRKLDKVEWTSLFLSTSPTLMTLAKIPCYRSEDLQTRGQSEKALQQLAKECELEEVAVASALKELCLAAPHPLAPHQAPLHWLRGDGLDVLRQHLGMPSMPRWRRMTCLDDPEHVWGRVFLGVSAIASLWLSIELAGVTPAWSWQWLWLPFSWVVCAEGITAVLHRLVSEGVAPRRLPRLDMVDGLGESRATLVVIPCLLTHRDGIDELAAQLEQHALSNRDPHVRYALVSDWADCQAEHDLSDIALLRHAQQRISALNERHPHAPFRLFHRSRVWSDSEQCWMGWERKRGKLEQLIELLATGKAGAFHELGSLSALDLAFKHLVTLDADTDMPPGALRSLVGVATHPLNLPRLDASRRRMVGGHAIFQPKLQSPLPGSSRQTWYHRWLGGQTGLDPYAAASSEAYQDLFGTGTFTGKGLLNVQACYQVLHGTLPESQVLSHDLLEGAIGRCASVTDVVFIESNPDHPDVVASRLHRWTRGDWQLLPFMWRPGHFSQSGLTLWKMLDNLRRSLVAPSSVLLLFAAMGGSLPLATVVMAVAAAYGAGPLIGAMAALAPSRDDIDLEVFLRRGLRGMGLAIVQVVWNGLTLLDQAVLMVDALSRALVRQFLTRRKLLAWTTAAAAQAASRQALPDLVKGHARTTWVAALGAALWAVAAGSSGATSLGTPLSLMLVWALCPVWIWLSVRRVPAPKGQVLSEAQRAWLGKVASDTWGFFETHVTSEHHHLPPDNVQFDPYFQVASRTSPTNIGMYLMSVMVVHELGHLSAGQVLQRVSATLSTLRALPRHRGHFYNWYDTRTLAVLPPAYVSTVDSGNLCGHLLAVAQALKKLGHGHALEGDLIRVAQAFEGLALEMDFSFLFDARSRLLHIGYRVDRQELDANHYDMLASECRLTSMLAIAKGDVPAEHWSALSRSAFGWRGRVGIRSWSGSMFEYWMPSLVVDEPVDSLLGQAVSTAVRLQMAAARQRSTPWGVSESGIAGKDHSLAYQYGPQGVAALAVRRTPPDEWVVAPYACLMAMSDLPLSSVKNLQRLEACGARGEQGFFEALDFSPDRQVEGSRYQVVRSHMAHHQGMALLGLFQALTGCGARPWLMSHPLMRGVQSLMHERVPSEVLPLKAASVQHGVTHSVQRPLAVQVQSKDDGPSRALWICNERMSALVDAEGVRQISFQGRAVSRWQGLNWQAGPGVRVLTRQVDEVSWLGMAQDKLRGRAGMAVRFQPDRVVTEQRHERYVVKTACWMAPDDDCFFIEVDLENPGGEAVEVELASYMEVCLSDPAADMAHMAFSKMFVDAFWQKERNALLYRRKARQEGEAQPCMAHFLVSPDVPMDAVGCAVDRADTLVADGVSWRIRPPTQPRLMPTKPDMSHAGVNVHTGQDPVASLGCQLLVPADGAVRVTFCVAVGDELETLSQMIDKYQSPQHVKRASNLSYTMASVRQHERQLDAETWEALLTLSAIVSSRHRHTRPVPPRLAHGDAPRLDRKLLWRFGLSGERPMVVVTVLHEEGLSMLRMLKRALLHWNEAGHAVDLVVLNGEPPSYWSPVTRDVQALMRRYEDQIKSHITASRRGLIQMIALHELSAQELWTIEVLATVRLQADGRGLATHVSRLRREMSQRQISRLQTNFQAIESGVGPHGIACVPPQFRFDPIHGGVSFVCGKGSRPSRPWSNVLANPGFGALVTHQGSSFTWAENSNLHQITPWTNDPLRDTSSELLMFQDLDTGLCWVLGRESEQGPCLEVEQRPGLTRISQRVADLNFEMTWSVDRLHAIKQVQVRVHHSAGVSRRIRLVSVHRWCLGSPVRGHRTVKTEMRTWRDPHQGEGLRAATAQPVLLANQLDHADGFGDSSVVVGWRHDSDEPQYPDFDWTCELDELVDEGGQLGLPVRLGQQSGLVGLPGAVLALQIVVQPNQAATFTNVMAHGWDRQSAMQRWEFAQQTSPADRLADHLDEIRSRTRHTQVSTPDEHFNALVNHWLPYQVLACRLWGRAGYYQAGGALGYRDQLQDAMALVDGQPEVLAHQILLHASRQFREGDVQHWWHPRDGAGVRTQFSDDRLWLPMALLHYLEKTGDHSLLERRCPYLEGSEVPPGKEDVYEVPRISTEDGSIYEHAARALERSLPVGPHGLALMGCGDWNDGMNRVGIHGKGESVWLSWFLAQLLDRMAPWAERFGQADRANSWRQAAACLRANLEGQAWDGGWYRRAWFDDGTPLGSHANEECRIDLIAQAWAVLSGQGDPDRARQAMGAALLELHDPRARLTALLNPPLQRQRPSAGYIQAYPPGVRENGGQYNHAAVWALMALAELKQPSAMWSVFEGISPAHRHQQAELASLYGLEPYVVAADIYTGVHQQGKGGWSWYTGTAGWLLQAAVERICGVQRSAQGLRLQPCLPDHWPGCEVCIRTPDGMALRIVISRDGGGDMNASVEPEITLMSVDAGVWTPWKSLQRVHVLSVCQRVGT